MIVLDRIQATKDPVNPEEFLVTIFWRDPEGSDDPVSGHASRNHGVELRELMSLPERMSKIGLTTTGDPVRLHDSR